MPRFPTTTQAAITRVVKAAQAAGLKIGRVEVEGKKIIVYSNEDGRLEPVPELDTWKAKRDAR